MMPMAWYIGSEWIDSRILVQSSSPWTGGYQFTHATGNVEVYLQGYMPCISWW